MREQIDWNEQNVATLREMWAAGSPVVDIARKVAGKASFKNGVVGKAHRLGLGPHPHGRILSGAAKARSDKRKAERNGKGAWGRAKAKPAPKPVVAKIAPRELTGDVLPADMRYLKGQAFQPLPGVAPVALEHLGHPRRDCKCHWPVSDGAPFLFCGAPAAEGKVYCTIHSQLGRRRDA